MMMGARPSKPTCPGEIAKATEAAARLIATMIAMPRIWPANTRPREKLRSEKKPTKRRRSSIFVDTKAPVDNKASERKFTLPPASCARLAVRASRAVRSGRARPHRGEQALQGRRDVVAQHRHPPIAFRCDPVELDDAAFACKRLVPVPGIVGPFEREQRCLGRRHLHDHVAELVAFQFGDELAERGPVGKLRDGKAPALGDFWIVGVDFRARLWPNKAGH